MQYLQTRVGIAMYAFSLLALLHSPPASVRVPPPPSPPPHVTSRRYDRHVYFFDVRGEAPKMLVMSNFEEPFNVMSSSVVMTLETNRDKLNAVLDLIPKVRACFAAARR
jgi:hypothetical protein